MAIFCYDDLRLNHICHLLKDKDPHIFIYPPVLRLVEYDIENGTNLVRTLSLYLENPKDLEGVCEKLFIHKNTLFYRMNKIREIMKIELYKGEEITFTMIALGIMNL